MSNRNPMPPAPEKVQDNEEVQPEKVEVKKPKLVEVVALREGFYKRRRYKIGQKFEVRVDKLGDWMKIADPILEAARQEEIAKELKKKKSAGK